MSTENASREFPGEYRLDVEDFGPIAKASVYLRPLTVFIGPSNTGKSYLAILVYALHQSFGGGKIRPYGDRLLSLILDSFLDSEASDETNRVLDIFSDWLLYQANGNSQSHSPAETDPQPDLPKEVDAFVRTVLEQVDSFGGHPNSKIARCFGVGVEETGSLVRRSGDGSSARVELSIPRKSGAGMVRYNLQLIGEDVEFSGEISGDEPLSNDLERPAEHYDESLNLRYLRRLPHQQVPDSEDLRFLLARMMDDVFTELTRLLYRNAYYLPADRTGVMHSHKAVVSALIQSAASAGVSPSPDIPLLSGVLADFLSELVGMDRIRSRLRARSRRFRARLSAKLATRLEHDVLKGAIQMRDIGTGYPSFDYVPHGWDEPLPLMRASSMISELAPVVLYLRHLVRPGDVLIIEEPESHLHPAMQVEFMRQIAGLVRAGIRLIVTTHSEWLLQELANLVQLSQLPEAEREGIAGADVTLESEQVGAWLFEPQASGEGSTVREIGLDESGLYPAGFDDVAAAMHNDWAEILSRRGDHE